MPSDKSQDMALSIGVFDGFHRGHQEVIKGVLNRGNSLCQVITFRENPKKLLLSDKYSGDLTTLEDKLAFLSEQGVSQVLIIDFSHEFSTMSGRDFFSRLKNIFKIRSLVVGYDFSFGKGGLTKAVDLEDLLDPGTSITIVPPVFEGNQVISSTVIRRLLSEGKMKESLGLLGHPYRISLRSGVVPDKAGETWFVKRGDFLQILPHIGKYEVLTSLRERIEMVFSEDRVEWPSNQEMNFREFYFI